MNTETAPGGHRPLDQANRLEPQARLYRPRQPVNRIHHRHLLSLLTQPESWYSFYSPEEGRWPRWLLHTWRLEYNFVDLPNDVTTTLNHHLLFACCEVSDVIGRRKLNFFTEIYAQSDSIVCLACNEYWLETCPCVAAYVVHCLSDFVTCVSLICVCAFLSFFKYFATI